MSFAILSYAGAAPEINLARGKPYTLSPAPNYRPCIGPSDVTDLTDGVVYTGPEQLWQRQGCVGWIVQGKPVVITLDLGQIEPIKGVSYHTAAGRAGVYWPSLINLQFSDDGKTYHDAGDLVEQDQSPKPQAYGSGNYYYHTYRTDALAAKGRYVRLSIITEGSFVFCDEIEVYRGADELLQRTMPGEGLDAAHSADAILLGVTRSGVRHRLRADLALVRSAVEKEAPTNAKPEMMSDLDSLQKRIGAEQYPASLDGFRAILPLGDLDAKIFAVYGRLLAAKKIEPLTLWHTPPYQMLQVLQTPGESAKGLQVRMMQNEHRAQAFNITNASGEPRQVHFAIKGLDGNDNPAWVQVSQVEYVDALPGGRYKEAIQSHPVAAALVPLAAEQGHYVTTVPAGMTRQIWLSVDSRNLGAGTRSGVIQLNAQGVSRRLPLEVVIAPVKMADEKALNVSTWDYIFDQMYGITAGNRAAAAKDLAAHSISPWCASSSTPLPKVGDFDSQGNLTGRINYARWNSFVKFWPGARHYFAFPAFMPQSTFGGFKMGTPQCDRAISQWAADWAKHNQQIGLSAGRTIVLLLDEPKIPLEFQVSNALIRSFKQGTHEISVLIDPIVGNMEQFEQARAGMELADIVMPDRGQFLKAPPEVRAAYHKLQLQGKQLWFYSCSGPTRFFDPSYYRMQPWDAFAVGAMGSCFWSYGDSGGADSWNEYLNLGAVSYTPVYLSRDSVTSSKYWEALREGTEDYQYLKMLADKIGAEKAQAQARSVTDLPQSLQSVKAGYFHKPGEDLCQYPEKARLKILDQLVEHSPTH